MKPENPYSASRPRREVKLNAKQSFFFPPLFFPPKKLTKILYHTTICGTKTFPNGKTWLLSWQPTNQPRIHVRKKEINGNPCVSITKKSTKCVVNWISLRIRVRSRNTQPHPKKKHFSCATHPTRSWSAYPAPAYLFITRLLHLRHRLIFHQWLHLFPQSLCQQQGFLLWCLLLCVIMWFQRVQRKWYFLHKPCAYWPRLFRYGRWSSWGIRVFIWGLTSNPEVGRWQEGLWRRLFFRVFKFLLTIYLRRGALL